MTHNKFMAAPSMFTEKWELNMFCSGDQKSFVTLEKKKLFLKLHCKKCNKCNINLYNKMNEIEQPQRIKMQQM